jgi:hypothetical protein
LTHRLQLAALGLTTLLSMGPAGAEILSEVARIPMDGVKGRIGHLCAHLPSRRLFVAAPDNNSVEVIDVPASKHLQSIKGLQNPQRMLTVPLSRRLIVSNGAADHISVIDTKQLTAEPWVALGKSGDGVRLDPLRDPVWIGAGGHDGMLLEVDPLSATLMHIVVLRGHPESFQREHKGQRVFVNVPSAMSIEIADLGIGKVVARWSVPGGRNVAMALDEPSHRLYVGTHSPPRLLVYNTRSGAVVANLPTVGDADDLFQDATAGRVYVSGGEGMVEVFAARAPNRYASVGASRHARARGHQCSGPDGASSL